MLIDTREQLPFAIPGAVRRKLDTGDYGVAVDGVVLPAVIERKSVLDLLGVVGGSRERFEKELARARKLHYFAIIIEGSRSDVIQAVRTRRDAFDGKLTVSHVMGSLAAWDVRGAHIHFEQDRRYAAAWTRALLLRIARDYSKT